MVETMRFKSLCLFLLLITAPLNLTADERPNIVLMMVDDLGFSDLGCYGGEIDTPHLDQLARSGLRFTQFYNCAKCETTRSTLLSGRYYPEVNNQKLENCVTMAEALSDAGYTTLMTGKWHLDSLPNARGFDRYFGHLSGATNFFRGDNTFRLNSEIWQVPEKGFYTTDANIDFAIDFLQQATRPDRPFFLYVAFNAPHYPLQAPREDVEKYLGRYEGGWDQLREKRFERQLQLGLLDNSVHPAGRPENVPAWDSLDEGERKTQELMMATYAAMIDRVDQNIGRLLAALEDQGKADNTIILFLSDNGACPFQRTQERTRTKNLMPWDPESYWTYDQGWAHACNTPFREYKQNQHEGGITTPMIVHWPGRIQQPGRITQQPGHIVDIMATCLDLAGATYPTEFDGQKVGPGRGTTLRPIFEGKQRPKQDFYFSFYGKNNALRSGKWKLVNKNAQPFELYNLEKDRTELVNMAQTNPEQCQRMKRRWDVLAENVGQAEKKKSSKPKNRTGRSAVFPNWQKHAVHQRRPRSGCIPTGYEMLLRSARVKQVDFDTFQDDFDLDKELGHGQTEPRNNFVSMAEAVHKKYPHIQFEQRAFDTGSEKLDFIEQQLKSRQPLLISLAMVANGQLRGWHIMPIVDADATRYRLLEYVDASGKKKTRWIDKKELARLHDQYPGGKDVAYLKRP